MKLCSKVVKFYRLSSSAWIIIFILFLIWLLSFLFLDWQLYFWNQFYLAFVICTNLQNCQSWDILSQWKWAFVRWKILNWTTFHLGFMAEIIVFVLSLFNSLFFWSISDMISWSLHRISLLIALLYYNDRIMLYISWNLPCVFLGGLAFAGLKIQI